MKKPYYICFTFCLFFFLSIKTTHGYVYFASNYFANMAFSMNSWRKPNFAVYGLLKHSLQNEHWAAHVDVQIGGHSDVIYNIVTNKTGAIFVKPYIRYQRNEHSWLFGFIPTIGSQNYIDEHQNKTDLFSEVELVNSLISQKMTIPTHYIVNSTFLHSHHALGISYNKYFFYDTIKFGVSYHPCYRHNHAFDLAGVYYNEYNNIGYGANLAIRYLLPGLSSSSLKNTYELSMGLDIDYMGLSYRLGYGRGKHTILEAPPSTISYHIVKHSLSYSLDKYRVGAYYLASTIDKLHNTYQTNIFEMEVSYNVSRYFLLKTAFYTRWLNKQKTQGFLLGVSVTI